MPKFITLPLYLFIYFLSGFMPRSKRRWVFISWSGKRFADNSKWLYLHAVKHHSKDIKSIFFARSPSVKKILESQNLKVCRPKSLAGVWHALRAKVYVVDNYSGSFEYWLSRGAKKVNLWHGIPLKKIGMDISTQGHLNTAGFHGNCLQRLAFKLNHPWDAEKFDMAISSSSYVSELFSSAFGLELKQIPVTGFPRNDVLTEPEFTPFVMDVAIYDELRKLREDGKKIIVYLPTFRDNEDGKSELPFDFNVLDEFLEKNNCTMIFKLHARDKREISGLGEFKNIRAFRAEIDLYPMLRQVDVLATDYSSVFFDFLLLDRPIIFYAYDLDEYLNECRAMYKPYSEATPGPVVNNFKDFLEELSLAIQFPQQSLSSWSKKRDDIQSLYHSNVSGGSSERVFQEIFNRFVLK